MVLTEMNKVKDLSPQQREAVTAAEKEVFVSAGAGSGKTRILIERFIHGLRHERLSPKDIVAITFTEKAANEMKERLKSRLSEVSLRQHLDTLDQGHIMTIHGFCLKILKENAIEAGIDPAFSILDQDLAWVLKEEALERLFSSLVSDEEVQEFLSSFGFYRVERSLLSLQGQWRSRPQDPFVKGDQDHEQPQTAQIFLRLLKGFDAEFERLKGERNLLDFDDIVQRTTHMLDSSLFQKRLTYRLIMIDEYQDVNALQSEFIDRLAKYNHAFMVGDVRQSIYGFRHADCLPFLKRSRLPQTTRCRQITLDENYRSHPALMHFVNRVFEKESASSDYNFGRLQPMRPAKGLSQRVCLLLTQESEGRRVTAGQKRCFESRMLASEIKQMVNGPWAYRDFAILLRFMTDVQVLEKELRKQQIPYHLVKGKGFYFKMEVTDILNALRVITNPHDDLPLMSVAKSPLAGLTDDTLFHVRRSFPKISFFEALRSLGPNVELVSEERCRVNGLVSWIEDFRKSELIHSPSRLIEEILKRTHFESFLLGGDDAIRRHANILKLKGRAKEFERVVGRNLNAFIRHVERLQALEVKESEAQIETAKSDAVKIMTVHEAKGLEFPVVILGHLNESFVRRSKTTRSDFLLADSMELFGGTLDEASTKLMKGSRFQEAVEEKTRKEIEEEKRLLYVGMTRAREMLICSAFREEKQAKYSGLELLSKAFPGLQKTPLPKKIDLNESAFNVKLQGVELSSAVGGEDDALNLRENDLKKKQGALPINKTYLDTAVPRDSVIDSIRQCITPNKKSYIQSVDLSVTDLMSFKYPVSPTAGSTNGTPLMGGSAAARFGNIYHAVLQHLDFSRPEPKEAERVLGLFKNQLDAESYQKLLGAIHRFLELPLAAQLRENVKRGVAFYRELPFMYKAMKEGLDLGLLTGQIDLMFQNGKSQWVVVDYKTGQYREEHAEQIRIYAFCLQKMALPVEKALLYYALPHTLSEVCLDPLSKPSFEEDLLNLYSQVRAQRLPQHKSGLKGRGPVTYNHA
jgi:ATP-dependent exoDNAse (exonuclease V) beta subunit